MSVEFSIATSGQLLGAVRAVVAHNDEALLCVAFANEAGIRLLEPALKRGADRVRLLSTTVFGGTTAAALSHASALGVQVRTLNLPGGTYHPKLYIGSREDRTSALLGSANLTSGLLRNIEVAALLSGQSADPSLAELRDLAEGWWDHPATAPWSDALEAPLADAFVPDLWEQLQRTIEPVMTVLTLADAQPNRVVEVTPTALWIETERSRSLGRGAQEVPAWMFNIAWDYLVSHRSLRNTFLLNDLNVHRSSLVCAVLALLPPVTVDSRRPIRLVLTEAPVEFRAAQSRGPYVAAREPERQDYVLEASSTIVEAWSTTRLPFEPTGWRKEFRQRLRSSLAELEVPAGQLLHAVYASLDRSFCDVENVLLYNVGMATFAGKLSSGLQIERSFAVPPAPEAKHTPFAHYHRYGSVAAEPGFEEWTSKNLVAEVSGIAWPRRAMKAADWWYAARSGAISAAAAIEAGVPFGMDIVITGPAVLPSGLHNVLKPLLDGVIAALQHHDGTNLDIVSERLAVGLGCPAQEVADLLSAPGAAVLGATRLVRPYRDGVQWNPADDRCVAIRVQHVIDAGRPTVGGQVFPVERL